MRRSRVRFTISWLMIAVAVSAAMLGIDPRICAVNDSPGGVPKPSWASASPPTMAGCDRSTNTPPVTPG